ncbi:MAG TPA: periplasmic heavy metal sensor [Polyangiaceae bacterium]|nr:periplasmic heavy metal sensor [Polyangiaceae bacterium]
MFIGLVFGTLCLVGLGRAVFGRRWFFGRPWYGGHHGWGARGSGHGYGYSYGRGDGWGGPPWRGGGRTYLWSLLARLDATPSQERAIQEAVNDLKGTAFDLFGSMHELRGDVARTIEGPSFDESAFQAASLRVDETTRTIREAVAHALGKIHAVLDDRQRKTLSDMIAFGWQPGC